MVQTTKKSKRSTSSSTRFGKKNQITKRYELSQISDCTLEEDIEEVDAMELCPRVNTKRVFCGNDRDKRNFGSVGRGSSSRGSQNDNQDRRQNYEDNLRGNTRGRYNQNQNRNFHSQYQNETKPAKWDTTFQVYDIDGKSLLEALKMLAAYNILQQNGPETNYSRHLLQHNPNLKGRFNSEMKQETYKQPITENKTTAKEITKAFSAVKDQEISEENRSDPKHTVARG